MRKRITGRIAYYIYTNEYFYLMINEENMKKSPKIPVLMFFMLIELLLYEMSAHSPLWNKNKFSQSNCC